MFAQRNFLRRVDEGDGWTVRDGAGEGLGEAEIDLKLEGVAGVFSISFLGPGSDAEELHSDVDPRGWIRKSLVPSGFDLR